MNLSLPRLPAHLACAALLASCGGAASPNNQPVAVELPTPPPSPDPPSATEPEPTASPRTAAPEHAPRPPAPPPPLNTHPPSPDAAAAEALFEEGKQLMAQGDIARACPKFEESNRLDPAIGTLLNLAACEERAGKKPKACAHFFEAAKLAQQRGQQERAKLAQDRFQNLGCQP